MSDAPAAARLSAGEILALRFAARRQLARWANKPRLSPEVVPFAVELRGGGRVISERLRA
jgi:hypothetical protein